MTWGKDRHGGEYNSRTLCGSLRYFLGVSKNSQLTFLSSFLVWMASFATEDRPRKTPCDFCSTDNWVSTKSLKGVVEEFEGHRKEFGDDYLETSNPACPVQGHSGSVVRTVAWSLDGKVPGLQVVVMTRGSYYGTHHLTLVPDFH